jgi:hypothetical protein
MSEIEVFHVVCRECRTESVVENRTRAESLVEDHAHARSHRVVFAQVE